MYNDCISNPSMCIHLPLYDILCIYNDIKLAIIYVICIQYDIYILSPCIYKTSIHNITLTIYILNIHIYTAETEASILAQEYANAKSFKETVSTSNLIINEKVKTINRDLSSFLQRADDVQIQQGNGLALILEGLNKNINACHYGSI